MYQITATSVLRMSLIFAFLWLTACGSSGDDSTPPPDPAESSIWGEMEWGKGTWGK